MLVSQQAPGARALLRAIPSCPELTISNESLAFFLRNFECVDLLSGSPDRCGEYEYADLCPTGDGHRLLHDCVCRSVSTMLSDAGFLVREQFKPAGDISGDYHAPAPDLDVINFPLPNQSTYVEIGISSPLASHNIGNGSAYCPLVSANSYAAAKLNKYVDFAREAGKRIAPACLESTGALGDNLQHIFKICAENVSRSWYDDTAEKRTFASATFKAFHQQALAVTFWTASTQKRKQHDHAHGVEVQPFPTFDGAVSLRDYPRVIYGPSRRPSAPAPSGPLPLPPQ
jgi:hypothetical protein